MALFESAFPDATYELFIDFLKIIYIFVDFFFVELEVSFEFAEPNSW